jgi:hypothetical protein
MTLKHVVIKLVSVIITYIRDKIALMWVEKTLRVKTTLVRVVITYVRVKITLMRADITLVHLEITLVHLEITLRCVF